ncbi:MAG: glycerol-3-phosphate 1-O-acyltransferase PlsY [Tissierellaceae bacterium]
MKILLIIILSYLIGCFSSAYILGKASKNIDIRKHGSGNLGTTNALRVLGRKAGALTLLMDVAKGIIAFLLAKAIMGLQGGYIASIFVVLGHNFPVFLKFKGGKGVATSLGVLFMLNWKLGLFSFILGVAIIIISKYVSLGSLTASVVAPLSTFLPFFPDDRNLRYTIWFLGVLSIIRHRANIVRLYKGVENKIKI